MDKDELERKRKEANGMDFMVAAMATALAVLMYIGTAQHSTEKLTANWLRSLETTVPEYAIFHLALFISEKTQIPLPDVLGMMLASPFVVLGLLCSAHFTRWISKKIQ